MKQGARSADRALLQVLAERHGLSDLAPGTDPAELVATVASGRTYLDVTVGASCRTRRLINWCGGVVRSPFLPTRTSFRWAVCSVYATSCWTAGRQKRCPHLKADLVRRGQPGAALRGAVPVAPWPNRAPDSTGVALRSGRPVPS